MAARNRILVFPAQRPAAALPKTATTSVLPSTIEASPAEHVLSPQTPIGEMVTVPASEGVLSLQHWTEKVAGSRNFIIIYQIIYHLSEGSTMAIFFISVFVAIRRLRKAAPQLTVHFLTARREKFRHLLVTYGPAVVGKTINVYIFPF